MMRTILLLIAVCILSSFQPPRKPKAKLPQEFVYVPAGTFTMSAESAAGNFIYDSSVIISMNGFYLSKYEVSNQQYRKFITEVSAGMPASQLSGLLPDTSAWEQFGAAPMAKHYYSHPAYANYPVVNISYEGALQYCEWLQVKIQNDNPGFLVEVKIPSKAEWVYAARGGRSQAMFPWGKFYLRNSKGEPLCNFNMVPDAHIYRDRTTGKPAVATNPPGARTTFTSEVRSFYPNDYGLYNMCGNAAEMVEDKGVCMGGSWNDYGADVQILAKQNFQGATPTVGFRPLIIVKERH